MATNLGGAVEEVRRVYEATVLRANRKAVPRARAASAQAATFRIAAGLVLAITACTSGTVSTQGTSSPPAPNVESPSDPCATVLSQGCSGNDVIRLQELLRSKGFAKIRVDGQFGTKTLAALDAFEVACQATCHADGMVIIDGEEWRHLDGLPTVASSVGSP